MSPARTDVVPASPLLRFVPEPVPVDAGPDKPYGVDAWCADVAAALGVSHRTVVRWVARMRTGGTIGYWYADELCAYVGVPFRSIYPDAA